MVGRNFLRLKKSLACHLEGGQLVLIILCLLIFPQTVFARVTPEDIVNSQRKNYQTKVQNCSPVNKQKLESLAKQIAEINKFRTDQLERIMEGQAAILDEYQRRSGGTNTEAIEKARYWITYAHEAVAYQAAKIYIFDLSSEGNLKNDVNSTINLVKGELFSARSKVINSGQTLKGVITQ
ncbi:MAG: hypothetical protein V1808_02370 [Candidatus Daviesbacteria bacterium]